VLTYLWLGQVKVQGLINAIHHGAVQILGPVGGDHQHVVIGLGAHMVQQRRQDVAPVLRNRTPA
jgi:hypothetical protein